MRTWVKCGFLATLLAASAAAEDWPQFLGPTRDGVSAEKVDAWKRPPKTVWTREIGQGFSSPVVSEGRLILFHRVRDEEVVVSMDAKTGKVVWTVAYPARYRDDFGFDEGPRATPTVSGNRVYTFGAEGVVQALDFASGKRLWSVNTHQTFGVRKGFFGAAGAPLVENSAVILNAGGAKGAGIVALDKDTGKTLWTATSDEASYSSGTAAAIGGVRHALFFTRAGLAGVEAASGKVRFQHPWRARSQASVNAATPLVVGGLIFISASYNTGATLLRVEGSQLKTVWTSDDALSSHYSTAVHRDGYLFGFHGRQEEGQSLRCIELKTGKVRWSEDGFGAGTLMLAAEDLLILRENGELVLAPATPQAFRPSARARVLPGTVRAYPALSDGYLYVRNGKTLACVDLRNREGKP